jgi:hypothetical protein
MNTPVNFELAKLLKEEGFDEYCLFVWNEENLEEPYYYAEHYEMICNKVHYYGDIPMINNSYIEKYATYVEKNEETEECYELLACPTIAEVVMWLYEKHGIWISVHSTRGYFVGNWTIHNTPKGGDTTTFNSPTEAYEAAIEYTLKHLI